MVFVEGGVAPVFRKYPSLSPDSTAKELFHLGHLLSLPEPQFLAV